MTCEQDTKASFADQSYQNWSCSAESYCGWILCCFCSHNWCVMLFGCNHWFSQVAGGRPTQVIIWDCCWTLSLWNHFFFSALLNSSQYFPTLIFWLTVWIFLTYGHEHDRNSCIKGGVIACRVPHIYESVFYVWLSDCLTGLLKCFFIHLVKLAYHNK